MTDLNNSGTSRNGGAELAQNTLKQSKPFNHNGGTSQQGFARSSSDDAKVDIKAIAAKALANARILLPFWVDGQFEGDEFITLNSRRDDENLGSFKINVKTGRWCDFATGDHGGDLVSYYAYIDKLQEKHAHPQQEAAKRISRDLDALARKGQLGGKDPFHEEPDRPKTDWVSRLWNTATCIPLLSMVPYLKDRDIGEFHKAKEADVRLHDCVKDGDVKRPALILAIRETPEGELKAIQRIFLSDDLTAKASVDEPKKALGKYKGSAIWLGWHHDTLMITEGLEDGLSLREAGCPFVACGIAAWNMANLTIPAGVKRVILFQDNDVAGRKAARKAAATCASQGFEVLVAGAPDGIKDANDLLRDGGVEAVRKAIAEAERIEQEAPEQKAPHQESGQTSDFIRDGKGAIVAANKHNINLAIEKLGISVRWNAFTNQPMISSSGDAKPRFMSDDDFVDLRLLVQEKHDILPAKDYFMDVVKNIARANKFHPVRERFDALEWDGEKRIDDFFINYAGADDTELNRAMSRKFFMAGIRRITQPGCKFDTMLVLEGEQGTGKSSLLKLLAMEEEFFSDDFPLGGDAKHTIEQTRGKFLIECAELKGMKASDVTKVKSQLSRTHDYARLTWDRVASEVPRQFLLAGTTNNKKYLKDDTGDRRFWPMETRDIRLDDITPELVGQLWAEAKAYAKTDEPLVIDRSLWAVAAEEQAKRRFENKYVSELEAIIGNRNGFVRAVDVPRALNLTLAQRDGYVLEEISGAMKALGFERKTIHIAKEHRTCNEKEKQCCYVRGDGEESKHPIVLIEESVFRRSSNSRILSEGGPELITFRGDLTSLIT